MSMSRLEKDYLRLSRQFAILDGRMFGASGTVDLPSKNDTATSRVIVGNKVYMELADLSYTDDFTLELWEGGASTGGQPVVPWNLNRNSPKKWEHSAAINVNENLTDAERLWFVSANMVNQDSSGILEGFTGIVLNPGIEYNFRAIADAPSTKITWTALYINLD